MEQTKEAEDILWGRIELKGMEFFAYHGYYEAERQIGNRYGADIAVLLPLNASTLATDELAHTVNYEQLYALAHKVMQTPQKLLETLAAHLVTQIFSDFPEVQRVECTVRKFNPPIGGICRQAAVTLSKTRGESNAAAT